MVLPGEKVKPNDLLTDDQVDEIDAAIRRAGYSSRSAWAESEDLSPSVLKQIMSQHQKVYPKYAGPLNQLVDEQLVVRYNRAPRRTTNER